MIRGAAAGRSEDKEEFARRYLPVVRAYLGARWRDLPLLGEIDDAAQDVFLDCFKEHGALGRADPARPGGFRAYFYGVVRNVARRVEERRGQRREGQGPAEFDLDRVAAAGTSLSDIFDRAWGLAIVKQARARQAERAAQRGRRAQRRLDLLRLRLEDGLPIREIAQRWELDPALLHREYRRARMEFKEALLEVVAFHRPGPPEDVEDEAARLLDHIS